jgi:nitric oxide reductase activation protein
VHEGSFATSGHYYVYIKTKDSWIKFNDERVEKVTRERALHHNYGGQSETFEYQPKEMKVVFKSIQNKATAYMLVYANKELFPMLFAEVKPEFPAWLIEQTKYKL